MKRRLPMISQGEVVLAAISLPPLTGEANRHAPRPAHPGSAHAASNAARIAASANRPGPVAGPVPSPPSSTASAANPTPVCAARDRNRRSHPRAVVCGTPARSAAGAARTNRRPPARSPRRRSRPYPAPATTTPGEGHHWPSNTRSAPAARTSSGTACVPPRGHTASNPTTTPSAWRTTDSPGAGTPQHGRPPRRHRPSAGRAIRWPRATTPPWIPSRVRPKRGEKGSLTFQWTGPLNPRPAGAAGAGIIAKEHGRTPADDAQEIRPSTARSGALCPFTGEREPGLYGGEWR